MKYSEGLKEVVLKDYAESDLTVFQIAEKHHIKPRVIYSWLKASKTDRRKTTPERFNFWLTRSETDIIIKALTNYHDIDNSRAAISKTLCTRLTEKLI